MNRGARGYVHTYTDGEHRLLAAGVVAVFTAIIAGWNALFVTCMLPDIAESRVVVDARLSLIACHTCHDHTKRTLSRMSERDNLLRFMG